MAATIPGSSTLGIPTTQKQRFQRVLGLDPEHNDSELYAQFRADSLNRFYIPAVMQGHDSHPPTSLRTLHVLGNDVRAGYVSHALQGIYESVKTISLPPPLPHNNVVANGQIRPDARAGARTASRPASSAEKDEPDEEHISNLIVAGRPSQTLKLLESVKHRVDARTAICYVQDGLGVVEHVNNNLFRDSETRPSIVLGHMTHALAKSREQSAIRVMKPGAETVLTGVRPFLGKQHTSDATADDQSWQRSQSMLASFAQSRLLHARGVPLHDWLWLKIPSLMFASVADPICVLLDCKYEHVLPNYTARRLIDQLLDEIADVVARIHEVRRLGSRMQDLLRGEGMKKQIFAQLHGKKDAPSPMVLQLRRGQLTDIEYLNGYFLRRAKGMGMKMPVNQMVMDIIKAKHKEANLKSKAYIPWEMASRHQL